MRLYKSGTSWCFWRWTLTQSEYITRLHLVKTPWFAVCLHWIHKADPDPWLHDHPVSFLSIRLKGSGYFEERADGWHERRFFNWIRATTKHRIRYVHTTTLTLALMGPKTREWGFHTRRGWIYWKDYYREKAAIDNAN